MLVNISYHFTNWHLVVLGRKIEAKLRHIWIVWYVILSFKHSIINLELFWQITLIFHATYGHIANRHLISSGGAHGRFPSLSFWTSSKTSVEFGASTAQLGLVIE